MIISDDDTLEYFTVELTSFTTTPTYLSLPQSLSLEFRYFDPFSTGGINWNMTTGISIGETITVSSSENSAAFDKMQGFIADSGFEIPQILSTMAWGFGGVDGSATANFLLTAHGDVSPVPEPGTFILLGLGLLGITGIYRRKK